MSDSEKLATTYFEEALLDESQRNIAWLLAEFDPGADTRDQLLLTNIIGEREGDASVVLN